MNNISKISKCLITPLQLDALKEIGNIGTGHAATALSQLISCPVHMEPPRVRLIEKNTLKSIIQDQHQVGVRIRVLGYLRGDIYFLVGKSDAEKILGLLGHSEYLIDKEIGINSAVSEIANIMAGAYTTALYKMSGLPTFFSVPEIMNMMDFVSPDLESTSLLIENHLSIQQFDFHSQILLHPDTKSLELFLQKIGVPEMEEKLRKKKRK